MYTIHFFTNVTPEQAAAIGEYVQEFNESNSDEVHNLIFFTVTETFTRTTNSVGLSAIWGERGGLGKEYLATFDATGAFAQD